MVGVAQHDDGQLVQFDLEHGQVGFWVGAHDACFCNAAVGQGDGDLIRAFDHVVVGQDIAVRAHDHAATQSGLLLGADLVTKEEMEPGVVQVRAAHLLAGVDADHGRHGLLGGSRQAAGDKLCTGFRRRFQQGNAGTAHGGAMAQPAWLQRGNNEIGRQQHGDGL